MFMYEKDNKLNLTFDKTVIPPDVPDLVISKEDGITKVSIEGESSSLPSVTDADNGKTLVVQDGQWVIGAGGGGADLTGLLNNNLSKITVDSSVKALDAYSLYNKNLTEVRIKSATAIGQQALACNPSLYHVIIETNSVCGLGDKALMATSVDAGAGWIYVPSDLVDSYKSSWVAYADQIVSLDEYPKEITITETISDSWEDIFAAEEDDSYKTKYSVGDTKVLDINGVKAIMQIVAFDTDSLSDNSGTAKISWLCKNVPFMFSMNPNNSIVGGWEDTLCRDRLINNVLPDIPEVIRSNVKEVNKTYYDENSSSTKTVSDTLFILSAKEVAASVTPIEDSGVVYSSIFSDNNSRIKNIGLAEGEFAAAFWWLRSSNSDKGGSFRLVGNSGGVYSGKPSDMFGVSFGFCT
jgi:hypothetical protein